MTSKIAGNMQHSGFSLRRLVHHTSIYLVGSIATRASGFLLIPMYSYYLSPADYGVVELIELCTMFLTVFFGLDAIGMAMVRIFYDYSDTKAQCEVISSAVLGTAVLGLPLTAVACLFSRDISRLFVQSDQLSYLFQLAFIAMFSSSLGALLLTYYRIRERPVFYVMFSAFYLIIHISLNIYLIAFVRMGIWGFVLSKLLVSSLGTIVLLFLVMRETGWSWKAEPSWKMLSFGAPQIITGLAFACIHFSDRLFLVRYTDLNEVGKYALAYKFAFLVTYLIGGPFARFWGTNVYANASQTGWRDYVSQVCRYLMFLLFAAGLAIGILGEQIIPYITTEPYWAAAALIPILALAYVFREAGDFFRKLLLVKKRSLLLASIAVFCAVINLILNYWLIPQAGSWGAVWATLITWVIYLAACWYAAQRDHALSYSYKYVVFMSLLSFSVLFFLYIIPVRGEVWQWALRALMLEGFVLSVWMSGYFPQEEKSKIVGYLSQRCMIAFGLCSYFKRENKKGTILR